MLIETDLWNHDIKTNLDFGLILSGNHIRYHKYFVVNKNLIIDLLDRLDEVWKKCESDNSRKQHMEVLEWFNSKFIKRYMFDVKTQRPIMGITSLPLLCFMCLFV